MIPRRARTAIHDALARQAAVALTGPRQVGKTTLALAIAAEKPSDLITYKDDPAPRANRHPRCAGAAGRRSSHRPAPSRKDDAGPCDCRGNAFDLPGS